MLGAKSKAQMLTTAQATRIRCVIGEQKTLLMERIAAPEGARRTVRLKASLVERDSCGAPP